MMKKVNTIIFLFATTFAFGNTEMLNSGNTPSQQDPAYNVNSTVTSNSDGTYNVISEAESTTEEHPNGEPVKGKSYQKSNVKAENLANEVDNNQKEAINSVIGIVEVLNKKKGKTPEKEEPNETKSQVIEFPNGKSDSEQSIPIMTFIKGNGPNVSFKNIPENGIVLKYDNVKDYRSNFKKDLSIALEKQM